MRRLAVLIALLLAVPMAARGANYPDRPIRLVVGFGAGGPTDIPARYVAKGLSQALGQNVLVENKPAAGGLVATRDVIAQKPDGYTLLLCTHFEAINTVVYKHPGFTLADLTPVSLIAKYYYGLAIANAVPATDFKSFVAYAKAHPGAINYATVGVGSAQEIIARQLEQLAGLKMVEVPFQGGAAPVQELVAGRIQFYVTPPLGVVQQYRAKQLKLIGVSATQRLPALPDVPTLREDGLDYVRFGWLGVCAPKGTPKPIVDTLNTGIRGVVASQGYRQLVETAGSIAESSTPAELGQIMTQTATDLRPTILEYHLQKD
jgi:tripartite-type tricarboxylate transporter receptor subunit TctC